ncbi:MAG: twin-arginine translocase subunit TatC [Gammaproteobacteria bacterium]
MAEQIPAEDDGGEPQTLMAHLLELRTRLMRIVFATLGVFVLMAPFANKMFTVAARPLMEKLPEGMLATQVGAPVLAPFKLAFLAAVFITIPVTLHQTWAFVAPGLYLKEKRLVVPLMISSTLLFYVGVAFAYFVVFPLVFEFLVSYTPAGVEMQTDMTSYLDFMLALFFAFGLAFEVPVAILLLVWSGFVTPEKLAEKRAYVVLGAFVLGMFLTPPDFISQTLLAIPMYLLFEVGIFMAKRLVPAKKPDDASDSTAAD